MRFPPVHERRGEDHHAPLGEVCKTEELLDGKCCLQTGYFGAGNGEHAALGKRNDLRSLGRDDYQGGANFDAVGNIVDVLQGEGATFEYHN